MRMVEAQESDFIAPCSCLHGLYDWPSPTLQGKVAELTWWQVITKWNKAALQMLLSIIVLMGDYGDPVEYP